MKVRVPDVSLNCWSGVPRGFRVFKVNVTALGCSLELDGKTLLLITMHISHRTWKNWGDTAGKASYLQGSFHRTRPRTLLLDKMLRIGVSGVCSSISETSISAINPRLRDHHRRGDRKMGRTRDQGERALNSVFYTEQNCYANEVTAATAVCTRIPAQG